MRFPFLDRVALPVRFERYVPGELHPDGRRYLPQLIFRLPDTTLIGVVDRHHYVDPELEGSDGSGAFVFLLSNIALQPAGSTRQSIAGSSSTIARMPDAYGQIAAIPSWELRRGDLPYETLYTELLLDVGDGVIGVRTSMTAPDVAATLGTERLQVGDWITVTRSRIDILSFRADRLPQ